MLEQTACIESGSSEIPPFPNLLQPLSEGRPLVEDLQDYAASNDKRAKSQGVTSSPAGLILFY